MDMRTRLLNRLLAPYDITAEEVLASEGVARACTVAEERSGIRILTGPPLMKERSYAPCEDEEAAIRRMRDQWMPFLSRAMRTASLREQRLGAPMRPAWSILVNPITLAVAKAAGIPGERLARSRDRDGRKEFVPLHDIEFEDMPSTPLYVRDGSHHDGADYLHGQFLLNQADHVVKHALQLLEDTRFPVRSISDAAGRETLLELRMQLPATTCTALVGRPLSDLLGLAGFEPRTPAGDCVITSVEPSETNGRTTVHALRRFVPAVPPPEGADMRWVGMTPRW